MSELGAGIVEQVLEACRNGADEAAEAIGRALDLQVKMTVGESSEADLQSLPETFADAGLMAVFVVGGVGAAFVLPKSGGLVPGWADSPDPTGQSKLTTLAQELGMILLPEEFMPEDFKTGTITKIIGGLARGQMASPGQIVTLSLEPEGGQPSPAYLVWPLASPDTVLGGVAPQKTTAAKPAQASAAPSQPAQPNPQNATAQSAAAASAGASASRTAQGPGKSRVIRISTGGASRYEDLPQYTRSLLKVKVDVSVTLACQKRAIKDILGFGPGSIIQFDKSCEEMLDLDIGDLTIATGEAVKVGEKFGLRINQITLPEERFNNVGIVREAVMG